MKRAALHAASSSPSCPSAGSALDKKLEDFEKKQPPPTAKK